MAPRQTRVKIAYNGTEATVSELYPSLREGKGYIFYTTVRGDSIWSLSKKYLGSGSQYMVIYNANIGVIEQAAKEHGRASSEKGLYLYEGIHLVIPRPNATVVQEDVEAQLSSLIEEELTGFSYVDVASGQSDSATFELADVNNEWLGKYMPKKGTTIGAKIQKIVDDNETLFDCGVFTIDDISFSGRPISCSINGVSVPAMEDFKSLPKTKTFEKTTIKEIAMQIATAAAVELVYDADEIKISEIEQNDQTDSAFLYGLCENYGLAMKAYNQKIVIYDIVKYERKAPVLTINETDMERWSYNTTVQGTYTGVNLNYDDPDLINPIKVKIGKEGRMFSLNQRASSQYDAELQAAAKVNAANRQAETLEVSLFSEKTIAASQCVYIKGLNKIDGRYFVDSVKHSIGGRGYTIGLSLHKIQTAITASSEGK